MRKLSVWPFLMLSMVFLGGCAIHLVSDYDADMDKGVTDIGAELTQIVSKMRDCAIKDTRAKKGTAPLPKDPAQIICNDPSSTYSVDDYNKIRSQLETLIVRSEANGSRNHSTTESLINLEGAILEYPSQTPVSSQPSSNANPDHPVISIQERQQLTSKISLADLNNLTATTNSLIQSIMTLELAKKSGQTPSSK